MDSVDPRQSNQEEDDDEDEDPVWIPVGRNLRER